MLSFGYRLNYATIKYHAIITKDKVRETYVWVAEEDALLAVGHLLLT